MAVAVGLVVVVILSVLGVPGVVVGFEVVLGGTTALTVFGSRIGSTTGLGGVTGLVGAFAGWSIGGGAPFDPLMIAIVAIAATRARAAPPSTIFMRRDSWGDGLYVCCGTITGCPVGYDIGWTCAVESRPGCPEATTTIWPREPFGAYWCGSSAALGYENARRGGWPAASGRPWPGIVVGSELSGASISAAGGSGGRLAICGSGSVVAGCGGG